MKKRIQKYKITDGIVRVPITRRNGEKYIVWLDEEDAHLLDTWTLFVHRYTDKYIAPRVQADQIRKTLTGIILNPGKGFVVDHINQNTLDNRRCNLRIIRQGENTQNAEKRKICSSMHRGVKYDKARNKWRANSHLNGVGIFLGRFDTEEEAAKIASDFRAKNMPFSKDARLASQQ